MFRGTCSSTELLKGYMASGSLGTPGLKTNWGVKFTKPWNSAAHNCKSSLCHYLFEYEQSSTKGVRLEWRTPSGKYNGQWSMVYCFI